MAAYIRQHKLDEEEKAAALEAEAATDDLSATEEESQEQASEEPLLISEDEPVTDPVIEEVKKQPEPVIDPIPEPITAADEAPKKATTEEKRRRLAKKEASSQSTLYYSGLFISGSWWRLGVLLSTAATRNCPPNATGARNRTLDQIENELNDFYTNDERVFIKND